MHIVEYSVGMLYVRAINGRRNIRYRVIAITIHGDRMWQHMCDSSSLEQAMITAQNVPPTAYNEIPLDSQHGWYKSRIHKIRSRMAWYQHIRDSRQ